VIHQPTLAPGVVIRAAETPPWMSFRILPQPSPQRGIRIGRPRVSWLPAWLLRYCIRPDRPVPEGMIHHSDAGSQYTSIRFTETLALQGLSASIGSIGDAYDNAVAESVIGLFKNEAIAEGSPFRTGPIKTINDVEEITMNYAHWHNSHRLHSLLDNATPQRKTDSLTTLHKPPHHPVTPPTRSRHKTLGRFKIAQPGLF
jgi:integrase-like protein